MCLPLLRMRLEIYFFGAVPKIPKMSEQARNILRYQNKLLPLRQYNASLCRKATFDVAHPVGQWSVSL